MADLPSVFLKVNDVQMDQDAAIDEYTLNQLGQNDNYLKDAMDSNSATRASADAATLAKLGSIKTQLNNYVTIHENVGSNSLASGVEAVQANHMIDVRFEKNTGTGQSFVSLHVTRFVSGDWQTAFETNANMGLTTSQWDYAYWTWDAHGDQILWYAFKDANVVIP